MTAKKPEQNRTDFTCQMKVKQQWRQNRTSKWQATRRANCPSKLAALNISGIVCAIHSIARSKPSRPVWLCLYHTNRDATGPGILLTQRNKHTIRQTDKSRQNTRNHVFPDLVAWHSGRTSVSDRRTFAVLRSTCGWRLTTYVGKPSAVGQPTRPTQPVILSGVDKWVVGCN